MGFKVGILDAWINTKISHARKTIFSSKPSCDKSHQTRFLDIDWKLSDDKIVLSNKDKNQPFEENTRGFENINPIDFMI